MQMKRRLRPRPVDAHQTTGYSDGISRQKDGRESYPHSLSENQASLSRGEEGRQRFGGARAKSFPYSTGKPFQYWKERFSVIDRLVSRSDPSNEKEVGALRSFRNEMLEIERQKVSTAKAKLAVMQESLVLKKEELDVQKSLLFYVKSISLHRNASMSQRRPLHHDRHSNVATDKYPSLGLWDLPRPDQSFQNDLYH